MTPTPVKTTFLSAPPAKRRAFVRLLALVLVALALIGHVMAEEAMTIEADPVTPKPTPQIVGPQATPFVVDAAPSADEGEEATGANEGLDPEGMETDSLSALPVSAAPSHEPLADRALRFPAPATYSKTPARENEAGYWTTAMDIKDEAAVWAALTKPITVLRGNQRKTVVLREQPDESSKGVGDVTMDSQGLRVIETLDNGWSLVETYSSSFHFSQVKVWGEMVQGYVRTDLLEEKQVNQTYGLVIDKLTQRLYIFKDGKLLTDLLISTGLANERQPYNETQSGEYITVSKVGTFDSEGLICEMGLRFNNGNIIHMVPYTLYADGAKNFQRTEPKLGYRASHGCVRVQRQKNPDGANMAFLWNNIKNGTKVLIWEDYKGRQLDIPDHDHPLFYNPKGGKLYHSVADCPSVKKSVLPMTGFTYGELENSPYKKLTPCPACAPVMRQAEIKKINKAHE